MSEIRFNRWSHQSGTGGIYQDSSGNIGIGTSTPTSVLDIQGGSIKIGSDLLTSSGVSTFTSGLNVTSGSVGIGTDNPGAKLDLYAPVNSNALEVHSTTGNVLVANINVPSSGGGAIQLRNASGTTTFEVDARDNQNAFFNTGGSVGIGTDNPQGTLSVGGNISLDVALGTIPSRGGITRHTNNYTYFVGKNDGAGAILNNGDGTATVRAENPGGSAGFLLFETGNGSETLRITANQRVGIGSESPQSKLDVAGEIRASGIAITTSYPTISPSLNLNFARSRSLDNRIQFTRASTATYVGRDGLIKTAVDDEPRFDHDPDTLESLGLLIEDSRTNYVNHYLVNSGTGWATDQRIIFSSTTEPAPDGSSNNQKMAANTDAGVSHSTYKQVTGTTAGTVHTFSVYMKSAGSDYGFIYVDTSGGRYGGVAVQFSTGNTAVMAANGIGTQTDTSVTAVGNGWYRLSVSGSFSSTTQHYCHIDVGNDLAFSSFTGNGTDGIYVWGAQLEAGSFPTSIIPTSGSSVTRAKDDALITGESFESWINKEEGTWFIEYKLVGGATALMSISNTGGSVNERYMMWNIYPGSSAESVQAASVDGGVIQANIAQSITSSLTQFTKAIFAVKENDFAITANGLAPVTDTSGTVYNSPTQLRFAYGNGSSTPHAHFKSCIYYPKRLTNAQLQLLTS